jgi:uncharacterized protein (TIGR02452 family)
MAVTRSRARVIAQDAVRIMTAGEYVNLLGEPVAVGEHLLAAVAGTVSYPPDAALPSFGVGDVATQFEVRNETTLACAERLTSEGRRVVALNFASAKHPGGGFLGGAIAQEESLCRSSGLYACLNGNAMYAFHAKAGGGFYTNYAIYSPDVPVFFTDAGNPLPRPYQCSFITSPAVNAGVFVQQNGGSVEAVRREMEARIDKVLAVAARHGHDTLILGAWGCGVFRNDPAMIAGLFRAAFDGRCRNIFRRVAFAVYDTSANAEIFTPFAERFGT